MALEDPQMLSVNSEIGRLRSVLVHEPGAEVDRMVPPMMDQLLFDDILFGDRAREEHGRLRRLLQLLGVEVVEANDLLVETLTDDHAREWLWRAMVPELPPALRERTAEMSARDAVKVLVEGELDEQAHDCVEVAELFRLPPLPNWCFQRDPQVVLEEGVILGAMASEARWREGLLTRAVFGFHPRLRSSKTVLDPLQPAPDHTGQLGFHRPQLEGGDVLILSQRVVAVGVSERTNAVGVEMLANALARLEDGPRWLVVVQLPHRRAYMHLDTVFTQVDRDAALVYPPVIGSAGTEAAQCFELDLHSKDLKPRPRGSFLACLAKRGLKLEPISCGGRHPLGQQREQWTDGANALALAPGVIVIYDRNLATADELNRKGFAVIDAEAILLGQEDLQLEGGRRVCVLLPSHEISRARGGPHCLCQPLFRDPL
jgi:arginine deiminase